LNKDQQRAYNKIEKFLDSTEKVISISGGAGTGKSWLIDKLYHGLQNIQLTATTNEAAKVIDGITIHKYLGLGIRCEIVNNYPKLRPHHIILIDEASMLQVKIMRILNALPNKVILVGDSNQLTVGITVNLMDYPFVELTQNMRAKSEHLKLLVNHLDNCVETQSYPKIKDHIGSHLEIVDDHKVFQNLIDIEQDDYIVTAYQNVIIDRYKNLGFNALTTYKVQGKSYPIVYIDARDFITSHTKPRNQFNNPIDLNTYLRLLSVAMSRAMYKIYVFTGNKRIW